MSDCYQSSSSVGAPGKVRVYGGSAAAAPANRGGLGSGQGDDSGGTKGSDFGGSNSSSSGPSFGAGVAGYSGSSSSVQHSREQAWDDIGARAGSHEPRLRQRGSHDDEEEGESADSFYRNRLRESFNDVRSVYQQPLRRPQQRPVPQQPVLQQADASTILLGRDLMPYSGVQPPPLQQQALLNMMQNSGAARQEPPGVLPPRLAAHHQLRLQQLPQQQVQPIQHLPLHVSSSFGGTGSLGRDHGYDSSTMSSKESSDSCNSAPYVGSVGLRIRRSASDQQLEQRDESSAVSASATAIAAAGIAAGGIVGGSGGPVSSRRRKEYSSADALGEPNGLLAATSNGKEEFFDMVRAFNPDNMDQRAPPPPDIHRVLRGRPSETSPATHSHPSHRRPHQNPQSHNLGALAVPNATASLEDLPSASFSITDKPDENIPGPPAGVPRSSKKQAASRTRSASELTAGFLRRIRGAGGGSSRADGSSTAASASNGGGDSSSRSSENSTPGDVDALYNLEEKVRHKAFVHFDCQSIGISFIELARRREARRVVNTTTGASAASSRCAALAAATALSAEAEGSAASSNGSITEELPDLGDGRGNSLIESCPHFRNEIGGEQQREVALTRVTGGSQPSTIGKQDQFTNPVTEMPRPPICNGTSILDLSMSDREGSQQENLLRHRGYVLEYVDRGALYYRRFFRHSEHNNYFGIDENLGPVAVSLRRERSGMDGKGPSLHRVIVRTSELCVMRGAILDDAVPTSSSRRSYRGVHAKDVLEYVCPELHQSCLRLALADDKTKDQLMKLDEQGINEAFKVGVLYCKSGQSTEEEMYNNQIGGTLLEDFLNLLGMRARLLGFKGYRGGLDNTDDTTGTHSVYASCCEGGAINGGPIEIMFHVSTLLPFTANNKQQLLRKRHIGNDIVTIVFQEPGAPPFSPRVVRSHFQHVFIVVRAEPLSGGGDGSSGRTPVRYKVAVSRSKDVPPFGPPVPPGATFHKPADLADFLLAKVINAENATHRSEKFVAMAVRTRREYLKDLATNYVTSTPVDNTSKLGRLAKGIPGSGKKKEKKSRSASGGSSATIINLETTCAVVWPVQLEDYTLCSLMDAYLAISADMVAVVEMDTRDVVFATPCSSVIGWTSAPNRLCLYYNHGECVVLKVGSYDEDDIREIVSRLARVTRGCETLEMVLRRNAEGQLGFNVHYEGVVSDVEPRGAAWRAGLISGSRLVEICKVVTATQTHDQVIDLLRTSEPVKILVIPPLRSGEPREASEERPSRRLLPTTSSSSAPPTLTAAANSDVGNEVIPSVRCVRVRGTNTSSLNSSPPQIQGPSGLVGHAEQPSSQLLPDFNLSYHSRSDSRDSNGSQRQRPLPLLADGPSPALRNASPASSLSASLPSASFYTEFSAELQRSKTRGGLPPAAASPTTHLPVSATNSNSSGSSLYAQPSVALPAQHDRSSSADLASTLTDDMLSKTMPEAVFRQHIRGGASRTSAASSAGSSVPVDLQAAARRRASRELPPFNYADPHTTTEAQAMFYTGEDSETLAYRPPVSARPPPGPELVHVATSSIPSDSRLPAGGSGSVSAASSTESVLIPAVGPVHILRAGDGSASPRHSAILSTPGTRGSRPAGDDFARQHLSAFGGGSASLALTRSPSYENLVAVSSYLADDPRPRNSGLNTVDESWRPRPAPRGFDEQRSLATNIDTEWSSLVDTATRAMDGMTGPLDSSYHLTSQNASPSRRLNLSTATALSDQPTSLSRATGASFAAVGPSAVYQQGHSSRELSPPVYEDPSTAGHPARALQPPLAGVLAASASAADKHVAEQDRIAALERSIEQLRTDNARLLAVNQQLQADNSRLTRSADPIAPSSVYAVSSVSQHGQPPPAPAARTRNIF